MGLPEKYYPLPRKSVLPSFFMQRLQDFLAGVGTNLRLSLKNSTTVQVVPDAELGIAAIDLAGQWRWIETTVSRAHPGGAKGTYTVWAVGTDLDVDNVPDPFTDHTTYAFDLRITAGPNPEGAGVEVFEKIGEIDWSGTEIEAIRQTHGSVTGPMLAEGALSKSSGNIDWTRDASGAMVASYKAASVSTAALIDLCVTTAKVAANAITEGKLGLLSVSTAVIQDLAVSTAKLAAEAVTTAKLANLAVTAAKLAEAAVETAKIANKAVTAPKIGVLPGARVKRTGASVNITSRGEFKPINFDAEDWDNDGMHSLVENTSRLTAVTGGVYIVHGLVQFSGPASGGSTSEGAKGDRVAALVKNGSPAKGPIPGANLVEFSVPGRTPDPSLPGSGGNAIAVSAPCQLSPGDFVELWVWQNSEETLKVLSGDGLHEPFLSAVFQHSL